MSRQTDLGAAANDATAAGGGVLGLFENGDPQRFLSASTEAADAQSDALRAIDAARLAIFAYRDDRDRPAAWPITPYRAAGRAVITSTLAFARKALHVRRDPRVALLVGGLHLSGLAEVRADPSGDEFVRTLLAQELEKYPPAAEIVRLPLHRTLFSWYFGRVLMSFAPGAIRAVPGDDAATLVTLGADGYPRIAPIVVPPPGAPRFVPCAADGAPPLALADGPAQILCHAEPTMRDLRQLRLRGELCGGEFLVRGREGTLDAAPRRGVVGEIRQHLEYHRRGRATRRLLRGYCP